MTRVPRPPHVHVKPDDRLKPDGSKFDREQQIPIGVKVRYGIAILVAVIAAFVAAHAYDRSTTTAHTTHESCIVQQRGLVANHHLSNALGDIGDLLAGRRPTDTLPPKVDALLNDLQAQATAYKHIESQQPQTRTC